MWYEIFRRGIIKRQWYWRLVAANGKSIAVGGEGFYNIGDVRTSIALVKASAEATIHVVDR